MLLSGITRMRSMSLPFLISFLAGSLSALLGLTVLIGWYSHNLTLIQVQPAFVPMQYNTALGFLVSGIGMIAMALQTPRLAQVGGALAVLIGTLTLVEYVLGHDLGIDQLLMEHYVTVQTSNPGRMAPNTALLFSLTGMFLLIHNKTFAAFPRSILASLFGSIIVSLGMVPLFGYLTNVETAYGWGHLTRMAVHTAVGFVVLGLGVVFYALESFRQGERGARYWQSIVAGISVLTISVLLWQALTANNTKNLKDTAVLKANGYSALVEVAMNERISMLIRVAERWQSEGRSEKSRWVHDVEFASYQDGYQAIEWVDATYHVRWVVPELGNESVIGMASAFDAERRITLDIARDSREVAVTNSIDLKQGGKGFLVYVPVYHQENFDGFVLGVFRIKDLIDAVLPEEVTSGYTLVLSDQQGEVYRRGTDALHTQTQGMADIYFYNTQWQIDISPSLALVASQSSQLPGVVLVLGAVMALLLALSIHLSQKARLHARQALAMNSQLETEISVRKDAERGLEVQAQALARSNSELEQFAYVASHDLQEPLRMVTSYMELLERRYKDKLDADANEFIGYAVDGAGRMKALITDLLTYSRVGSKGKELVATDCEAVLRDVLANLQTLIEDTQAEVNHQPLPCVLGDAIQLLQLFQNLIGNALKFRGEAAPRIEIKAEQTTDAGDWLFSVSDNGIGIDPQYYDRIFAVFQCLHSRDVYEGTGIGLAVCKKIVERHGGTIWLESTQGQGTTFYFTLANQQQIDDY